MTPPPSSSLALQRLYHWERTAPDRTVFTQPMGGGSLKEFTWKDMVDESRRMAAFLQQQGFEPGARIAILSKNCAWWMMADFAIWMAGHVSVPLYPTLAAGTISQILQHSESRLLFLGKLDDWDAMRPGVPAGLPCVSFALSPADVQARVDMRWDEIVGRTAPLAGNPVREGGDLATIMYTSGTTGMPKGVMHSFENFAWAIDSGLRRITLGADARMLSYLPLAHVAERALVEHGLLASGMHLFFAESLQTFARDLQRARPTTFFSVPRLWVKFQQGIHAQDAAEAPRAPAQDPAGRPLPAPQDPEGAGPRRLPLRRRRRRADAARPAALVSIAGPGHHRGLRHDRELRRVARHAGGHAPPRHRGRALRRREGAHRRRDRRDPGARPAPDAGLLQGARAQRRGLHRRRLAAHRRQGRRSRRTAACASPAA